MQLLSFNIIDVGFSYMLATGPSYGYTSVILAPAFDHFLFNIMACSDAHLALSEKRDFSYQNAYEVVIGGSNNTK